MGGGVRGLGSGPGKSEICLQEVAGADSSLRHVPTARLLSETPFLGTLGNDISLASIGLAL